MDSLFITGKDKNNKDCYFFVTTSASEKIVYQVRLEEVSRGDLKISNPRPQVNEKLPNENVEKEIERLSPRIVIENKKNVILDLVQFTPYQSTSLLQCRF